MFYAPLFSIHFGEQFCGSGRLELCCSVHVVSGWVGFGHSEPVGVGFCFARDAVWLSLGVVWVGVRARSGGLLVVLSLTMVNQ